MKDPLPALWKLRGLLCNAKMQSICECTIDIEKAEHESRRACFTSFLVTIITNIINNSLLVRIFLSFILISQCRPKITKVQTQFSQT